MKTRNQERFESITVEGAVLPPDMLRQIASGNKAVQGLKPADYHLAPGERINEAVSRAWNRMAGLWLSFKDKKSKLGPEESGRGMTREQWLLPLFQELGYGRLQRAETFVLEEKEYPISHMWLNSPIHLMGCGVDLDRRKKGEPGASAASPHSLVQEFLNRSDDHLWGFVSNGLKLRLLRDNVSLTRQAFIEFDLEAMMEGEIYPDFLLLWLLTHQSRVEGEKPEKSWLEKWHRYARASGVRILDNLRDGVEKAITALGRGFLSHKTNKELIEKLQAGTLTTMDFYRQLLRLVYRLIFLLVAESRDLLLLPEADKEAKNRYNQFYSVSRLREMSSRPKGSTSRYTDLWLGVKVIFNVLAKDQGYPDLALPGLGSFLWSTEALPDILECTVSNRDFLKAIYSLSFVIDKNVTHKVDYKNLGPEELGSVYEALLELHPEVNTSDGSFELKSAGGSERKTTGSYYTPASLIVSLLDTALEPVLRERKTEKEILSLKVCDPACGSGHFLLAAAHRIARRLAALRSGEPEPSPTDLRTALRDVIGHCIYGVDINPMSVELCKVGLWMEALEPGKPLSFLDHRIPCGNSLMGAYPALMKKGIPDDAFKPIEGDDKKVCQKYRALNKRERGPKAQRSFFDAAGEAWFGSTNLSLEFVNLDAIDDTTMEGIRSKQAAYRQMTESDNYAYNKLTADAWCAAFVWKKQETESFPYPIHEEVFRNIEKNPVGIPQWMKKEIERLARQYRFFHFHLAFPDVFLLQAEGEAPGNPHTGWKGGFDVVLGNPPWERIKLQEKEWFAVRRPDIADAPNAAARRKAIENLQKEDAALYNDFLEARRQAEGDSHFIRDSGKFPLCGRGDVNTYTIFAETNRELITSVGRVGCIVPSGIATDDTTKYFFQDLMDKRSLVNLYDFENRKKLFPAVDSRMKFCLLTLSGRNRPVKEGGEFMFFALDTAELREKDRRFTLAAEDISSLNPNTKTCPIFRRKRDSILCKSIRKKIPIWKAQNSNSEDSAWDPNIRRLIDLNSNAALLKTEQELNEIFEEDSKGNYINEKESFLRLYEGKMINFYNHRFADSYTIEKGQRSGRATKISIEKLKSPNRLAKCRFWIDEAEVLRQLPNWRNHWLVSYMDVCSVTNERTVIASVIPLSAPSFSLRVLSSIKANPNEISCLLANFCGFIFDYYVRQFVGGLHLSDFIMYQMPALPASKYSEVTSWEQSHKLADWITPRVLELTYTAWDLQDFARDCGYDGPPFVWDDERRFLMRCELDAAYFHLYGISTRDVDYIMDTFPIVKRKDQAKYGSYRTKEKILEIYQQMKDAMDSGKPYKTPLDSPPADPKQAHPGKK